MSDTKVITMYNSKGGVGKTTLTINLAETLGRDFNKKVLVIDNDVQCSLSFLANMSIKENGRVEVDDGVSTLGYLEQKYQWFGELPEYEDFEETIIRPTYLKSQRKEGTIQWEDKETEFYFDLIPSVGKDLSLAELIYSAAPPVAFIIQPENRQYGTAVLAMIVNRIKKMYDYDYIFIDCPPNLGYLVTSTLLACDSIIIPTITDQLSTLGIDMVLDNLQDLGQVLPMFKIRGVLFNEFAKTNFDKRTYDEVSDYASNNNLHMFKTIIPRNLKLKELSGTGEIAVQQNGKAWQSYRQAIYSLAKEIIEQDEENEKGDESNG